MKKMILRQWISMIAVFVWMIVIFSFSAQPAKVSSQASLTVGRRICSIFVPEYASRSKIEQMILAEKIEYPIRKTAHATEYAILGALLLNAMLAFEQRHKCFRSKMIQAFVGAVFYAMTDEFHQLFVPGRSGQITDVMIDGGGAFCGVILVYIVCKMKNKKYRQSETL